MTRIDRQATGIEGRVVRRGEDGYEQLRRGACWHAGKPERYPEVIVLANHQKDVVQAVKLARSEGLRIAVKSGGHSWSGSHLRDETILIDVSNLRKFDIDTDSMTGSVQPGLSGGELNQVLASASLYFLSATR